MTKRISTKFSSVSLNLEKQNKTQMVNDTVTWNIQKFSSRISDSGCLFHSFLKKRNQLKHKENIFALMTKKAKTKLYQKESLTLSNNFL